MVLIRRATLSLSIFIFDEISVWLLPSIKPSTITRRSDVARYKITCASYAASITSGDPYPAMGISSTPSKGNVGPKAFEMPICADAWGAWAGVLGAHAAYRLRQRRRGDEGLRRSPRRIKGGAAFHHQDKNFHDGVFRDVARQIRCVAVGPPKQRDPQAII
jgi:hypothetical protein